MADPHVNGEQEARWTTNLIWKAGITLGCVLASFSLCVGIALYFQVKDNLDSTNDALCTFHDDLGLRITQTQHFLRHPEEAPSFNDKNTLAVIRAQLANQIKTYNALQGLPCDPPPPPVIAPTQPLGVILVP